MRERVESAVDVFLQQVQEWDNTGSGALSYYDYSLPSYYILSYYRGNTTKNSTGRPQSGTKGVNV